MQTNVLLSEILRERRNKVHNLVGNPLIIIPGPLNWVTKAPSESEVKIKKKLIGEAKLLCNIKRSKG